MAAARIDVLAGRLKSVRKIIYYPDTDEIADFFPVSNMIVALRAVNLPFISSHGKTTMSVWVTDLSLTFVKPRKIPFDQITSRKRAKF